MGCRKKTDILGIYMFSDVESMVKPGFSSQGPLMTDSAQPFHPGSLTALRQQFQEQGFVMVENFLTSQELSSLNEEIANHYGPLNLHADSGSRKKAKGLPDTECEVIFWNPVEEKVQAFLDAMTKPEMVGLTASLLGNGYEESQGALVMYSALGGKGQAWHQDCPFDPANYNVNRLLYMNDLREEDGAIVVVPGSHRTGRIPAGGAQEPIEGEVMLTPKAGSLIFVHGSCFHRVTPNLSKRPRVSVNFRVFPGGSDTSVCKVGVYRNVAIDFRNKAVAQEA